MGYSADWEDGSTWEEEEEKRGKGVPVPYSG